MAKGDIEISISADASGAIKGFGKTETAAEKAARVINKGAKIAAIGFAAIGAGALALAKSAAEDAAGQARLAKALANTTGATKTQVAAVEDWISAQGTALGVADDQLRPAMEKLAAATGDVGEAQKLATLAMDVAAGTGKSLEQVSTALAKAQNGSVSALSRLGIKTKDSVKDTAALKAAQIAVAKAHNAYNDAVKEYGPASEKAKLAARDLEYRQTKLGEAQKKVKTSTIDFTEAQKRLTKAYGGQAATNANTLEGKLARLKLTLSETGETIGAALLPALTNVADFANQHLQPTIEAVSGWMRDNKPLVIGIAIAIGTVGAAFIAASAALAAWNVLSKAALLVTTPFNVALGLKAALTGADTAALEGNTVALAAQSAATKIAAASQWLLNTSLMGFPLVWIVAAIAAVIVAAVLIVKKWDKIKAALEATWKAIQKAFSAAWDGIKNAASAVWDAIKTTVSKALDLLKSWFLNWTGPGLIIKHWDDIKGAATKTVDWIKGKFSGLMDFFRGLPGKIKGFFSGIWDGLADGLKAAINAVLHLPLTIPVIDTHIPKIGKIGGQTLIPALAKGGVVTRPTIALVGEAGPEAVIPLNRAGLAPGSGGVHIENLTVQAAPQETIDSTLPRALAVVDLLYGTS